MRLNAPSVSVDQLIGWGQESIEYRSIVVALGCWASRAQSLEVMASRPGGGGRRRTEQNGMECPLGLLYLYRVSVISTRQAGRFGGLCNFQPIPGAPLAPTRRRSPTGSRLRCNPVNQEEFKPSKGFFLVLSRDPNIYIYVLSPTDLFPF
jgi:hypothetical protein